jgi:hypothetical protein
MTSELRRCCDKPNIIFGVGPYDCFYICTECDHASPKFKHGKNDLVELEDVESELDKLWNRSLEQEA